MVHSEVNKQEEMAEVWCGRQWGREVALLQVDEHARTIMVQLEMGVGLITSCHMALW